MTYNVFGGTLNLTQSVSPLSNSWAVITFDTMMLNMTCRVVVNCYQKCCSIYIALICVDNIVVGIVT